MPKASLVATDGRRPCRQTAALIGEGQAGENQMLASHARHGLGSGAPVLALLQQQLQAAAGMATFERFAGVPMAKKDPILGVTENFQADQNPEKINLGVVRPNTWTVIEHGCRAFLLGCT